MAVISTVTVGTDTYSVYALTANAVTDADSFWNLRLGAAATAWAAATTDDKSRALVLASDWIDRALTFSGTKTVSTQDREWPRDDAFCGDTAVTDGTTPDALATATFWLAGAITEDNTIVDGTGEGSNVKVAKAGSAEVEFFGSTLGSSTDTRLPVVANDYLKCYLDGSGMTIITPTGTGDGNTSAFCDDDFERGQGFS